MEFPDNRLGWADDSCGPYGFHSRSVLSQEEEDSMIVRKLVFLAIAGSLGTLARYGMAGWVQRLNGASFPLGTLAVNVTGCFLAGLLWTLFENRWPVSGETRAIVMIGFMGAFTTFSAYVLETCQFVRSSEWLYAAGNVAMQNGFGFAALIIGAALARMV
jgi:fluoride exporter